jgi:mono/diheme cytochrome c family protein
MKVTRVAMLVLAIALALYILIPNLSWAEDGAALFKEQCSVCYGPDGAGKLAANAPSVVAADDKVVGERRGQQF